MIKHLTIVLSKAVLIGLLCIGTIVGVVLILHKMTHTKAAHHELRVGVATGYAPWAVRDEHGELKGFDVDIAHEIARRLDIQITFVDMSPEMLMASVRAKKLDCMVAPMAITPEREQAFNMVHYQGAATTQWPIMMKKGAVRQRTSLESVKSDELYRLCVLSGTKQSEYALSIPTLTVHTYDSMAHVLMAIRTDKVDAALVDPDLGKQLQTDNSDMIFTLIEVPVAYQSRGNGIALHKDNSALSQKINDVITSMKADGFIAEKEQQWGIGRLS
jgi:ABC-type amino acid transport substrate-binding protein